VSEPREIEGWSVSETGARKPDTAGIVYVTRDERSLWVEESGDVVALPMAVLVELLRARGRTVVEPGAPESLPDGFYAVSGLPAEYGAYWRVLTHRDESNGGQPYVCAWGLSLWGREGEGPTWAYRTFGNRLSVLRERFPLATWAPDRDRAKGMQGAPLMPPGPRPEPASYVVTEPKEAAWLRVLLDSSSRYDDGSTEVTVVHIPNELAAKVARAAEVVGESVGDFCQAAIAARVMAVADGREGK
jgi:hypothetical protein